MLAALAPVKPPGTVGDTILTWIGYGMWFGVVACVGFVVIGLVRWVKAERHGDEIGVSQKFVFGGLVVIALLVSLGTWLPTLTGAPSI